MSDIAWYTYRCPTCNSRIATRIGNNPRVGLEYKPCASCCATCRTPDIASRKALDAISKIGWKYQANCARGVTLRSTDIGGIILCSWLHVTTMQSLKLFLLQHGVWAVVTLCATALAIIVFLALLSYFVFYPLFRRAHEAISAYLTALKQRHASAKQNRTASFDAMVDEFRQDASIRVARQGDTRAESAYRHFSEVAREFRSSTHPLIDSPEKLQRIGAPLLDLSARPYPAFPNVPTADQLSVQHATLRTAWVRLVVTSVILLALIGVNTGMLGQILRDLGFIPHDLIYFGVPLYLVFAFILTLVETGLGYIHTVTRPEPERISVWPIIAIVFAGVIASVEGFFYSQVAPDRQGFFLLPGGYQVHQTSLFFFWGATLVLVLFGLGMIWSTSLERISQSAAYFPNLVKQLTRDRERFANACERAERASATLRNSIDEMRGTLNVAAERATALNKEIDDARSLPPTGDIAPQPEEITRVDVLHLMHLAGFWLSAASVTVLLASVLSCFDMRATFFYLSNTVAILGGVAIVAVFVVLGALIPRGDVFLQGGDARRVVVYGSASRDKVAIGLGVLLSLLFATVLWRTRESRTPTVLWLILYVVGVSCAAATSQSASTSKGLRLWFRSCADGSRTAAELLLRSIIRAIFAGVLVVEAAALALAIPIFILRGRVVPSFGASQPQESVSLSSI